MVGMAMRQAKVVRAERFELVDVKGRMVAAWGSTPLGQHALVFYDEAGKKRALLSVDADGSPGLGLFDKAGEVRAMLSILANGRPSLSLWDENGQPRVTLGAGVLRLSQTDLVECPESSLMLFGETGTAWADLCVFPGGTPGLSFHDEAGKARVGLWLDADGTPNLNLWGKDDEVLWEAP